MNTRIIVQVVLISMGLTMITTANVQAQTDFKPHQVISQPVRINEDDLDFQGTENIIFVPENRSNPNSRFIGLHFMRLKAKEKSDLPPVVFLGAGPGEPYSVRVFYDGIRAKAWTFELEIVNQKRDVILINQRGNPGAPGLTIADFKFRWREGSLDQPFDYESRGSRQQRAFAEAVKYYSNQGIDLEGYDVINFVDDIESIRKFCGAEKIALVGNSFASQWALGYIQRYPKRVDRALFSCVEPLDHNYDDPQGIWEVMKLIDSYAQKDPAIAKDLPEIGLIEAYKEILARFEKAPISVRLKIPEEEIDEEISLGPDDLRYAYTNPYARGRLERIESWPKYITELYQADYRALALVSRGRGGTGSRIMIDPLFNNSIGVSTERESLINSREETQWIGDVNATYQNTRAACPTKDVGDTFRQHIQHDIPTIIIHGDMDKSTPYSNAQFLMNYLKNGHLITVKRGTHTAKRALILKDPKLAHRIYEFMNLDFNKISFKEFSRTLPQEFELDEFDFWPIKGETLFEKYSK